jgi:orotidine-5'-phosphate decarboxylase
VTVRNENLILALDLDSLDKAREWVSRFSPFVRWFKVGHQLFLAEGPRVIDFINRSGAKVFLDLKFYDIPNTVGQAAIEATRHQVGMFNVHGLGGKEMMKRCVDSAADFACKMNLDRPIILAVTLLTSHHPAQLEEDIGLTGSLISHAIRLGKAAKFCGLDGIITSGRELPALREALGKDWRYLVPGIRPAWAETNDQKRTETPAEAIRQGATFLVIGRPIFHAKDPEAALQRILQEMQSS